jgi:hypothetical protein
VLCACLESQCESIRVGSVAATTESVSGGQRAAQVGGGVVMRPYRIISGGQTGADLGGLRAGRALGYIPGETLGGWMPRNFKNELGMRAWMAGMYGMREHAAEQYTPRTVANLMEADITLVFGDFRSPGSRQTVNLCERNGKLYFINPTVPVIAGVYRATDKINFTVNIAGNRESGNRGIEAYVYHVLLEAWAREDQRDLLAAAPLPNPLPRLIFPE